MSYTTSKVAGERRKKTNKTYHFYQTKIIVNLFHLMILKLNKRVHKNLCVWY